MGAQIPKLPGSNDKEQEFLQLKSRLHHQVVTQMGIRRAAKMSEEVLRDELALSISKLCQDDAYQISSEDRQQLIQEIVNETFGYGPLDPLMKDAEISDILVNGRQNVFVEREGVLAETDIRFPDDETLLSFIQRLVSRMGRRIDESSPMVDAHLPDGSRLNAVIPPLSLRGPSLSIRKFRKEPFRLEQLVRLNSLSADMAEFLAKAVEARISIMISGATGTGKTTLLNSLSRFIPRSDRVITIEHTAELQLQQPDAVTLEARPPNIEGKGAIQVSDLMKNALRMRPDRIIVGECRGAEVFDVLQAMITGHDGSMSTIHASSTLEALRRMELMVALSGVELPKLAARQYISSAVRLIVHLRRLPTGDRKVVQIAELRGLENDDYHLEQIFGYRHEGVDDFDRAIGKFYPTGHVPALLQTIRDFGVECRDELFTAHQQTGEEN